MKKIFYLIIAVVIMVTLCFSASATEIVADTEPYIETEAIFEENSSEEAEGIASWETEVISEESEYHTLFTRVWEYANEYKTEILGAVGDIAIFILAWLIKIRSDKTKSSTLATNKSQTAVVNVVNDMVDGYNALKASYDKYGMTEDDRNRVVGALVAQNAAILETLVTMCANNKNLAQGTKDLVMLKYANCLKMLDDDEKLKAIVTAVRDNIGTSITADNDTEELPESTEV